MNDMKRKKQTKKWRKPKKIWCKNYNIKQKLNLKFNEIKRKFKINYYYYYKNKTSRLIHSDSNGKKTATTITNNRIQDTIWQSKANNISFENI